MTCQCPFRLIFSSHLCFREWWDHQFLFDFYFGHSVDFLDVVEFLFFYHGSGTLRRWVSFTSGPPSLSESILLDLCDGGSENVDSKESHFCEGFLLLLSHTKKTVGLRKTDPHYDFLFSGLRRHKTCKTQHKHIHDTLPILGLGKRIRDFIFRDFCTHGSRHRTV